MKPAEFHVTIHQGTTWELLVEWFDADDNPVDLTAAVARLVVKSGNTTLLERVSPTSIDLNPGQVVVRATATETAALDWHTYKAEPRYDLLVKLASGRVECLVAGTAKLVPSPTRTVP